MMQQQQEKPQKHLVVLIGGVGGLSDVGRHVVRAALEAVEQQQQQQKEGKETKQADDSSGNDIGNLRITVLTKYPDLLLEEKANWACGCPEPHSFSPQELDLMTVVKVRGDDGDEGKDWRTTSEGEDLLPYFENAAAVVCCVGNRQPFIGNWDSYAASRLAVDACRAYSIRRVVCLSSVGVGDDWPPVEFYWAGNILRCLFLTLSRKAFRDLSDMEDLYASTDDDNGKDIYYLLVRPVGIGEEVVPTNTWYLQKKKYEDRNLGFNMAKMDVARFMVREAIVKPTLIWKAVVIGPPL